MLLLFKTNDCLRHAERQLRSGADSFLVTLKHCLRVLLTSAPNTVDNTGIAAVVAQKSSRAMPVSFAGKTADRLRAMFYRLRLHVACVHCSIAPPQVSIDIFSQVLAADLPYAAGSRGRFRSDRRPILGWCQHVVLVTAMMRMMMIVRTITIVMMIVRLNFQWSHCRGHHAHSCCLTARSAATLRH